MDPDTKKKKIFGYRNQFILSFLVAEKERIEQCAGHGHSGHKLCCNFETIKRQTHDEVSLHFSVQRSHKLYCWVFHNHYGGRLLFCEDDTKILKKKQMSMHFRVVSATHKPRRLKFHLMYSQWIARIRVLTIHVKPARVGFAFVFFVQEIRWWVRTLAPDSHHQSWQKY